MKTTMSKRRGSSFEFSHGSVLDLCSVIIVQSFSDDSVYAGIGDLHHPSFIFLAMSVASSACAW